MQKEKCVNHRIKMYFFYMNHLVEIITFIVYFHLLMCVHNVLMLLIFFNEVQKYFK